MIRIFIFLGILVVVTPQAIAMQCTQKINIGKASWYGGNFDGQKTASGDVFNAAKFSAAHPTLPFGTVLKVVNNNNNRNVFVTVNDRGAFQPLNRVIDVSEAAAIELGMKKKGVAPVSVFYCKP